MSRTKYLVTALLVGSSLTACTHPVDEQKSGIETPGLWSRISGATNPAETPLALDAKAPVDQQWWKRFSDPALDSLIDQAIAGNQTLGIARARVEEARAARAGVRASLFPQIDATANVSRGSSTQQTFNDKPADFKQAGLNASWELDLFGKNQARTAEAAALVQSEEANLHGTRVTLLADVARNYFDLRDVERQIALTQQNLETQNKTLELTKAQFEGALASDFDVQRAAAQVSTTSARIPSLQVTRDTALNRLAVLLGKTPGTLDAQLKSPPDLAPLDPKIIVTAPASVLAERPDVRAAERRFAASISASQAATRELFPTINLLGFFGVQDAEFGANRPWSIGTGLVLPILHFGSIEAAIDVSDARQKQAFLNYQQTVLEALEDMENALSDYLHETDRNKALHDAVDQNRKAAALAKEQYTNGYSALLDVLVAERNELEAEASMTASDIKLRQDLIHIYTAAGGGWAEMHDAANSTIH